MSPRRPGQPPQPPRRPGQPKGIPERGAQPLRPKGLTPAHQRPVQAKASSLRSPGPLPSQEPPRKGSDQYQKLVFDADRFFEDKKYTTAFKIYRQALPLAPAGNAHVLKQLCRCYRKKARKAFKKDDFQKVFDLLQEMMGLERVTPHLKGLDYKVLAEAALELGHLDRAEEGIRLALDIKPELAEEIHPLQKKLKAARLYNELNGLH